VLFRPSILRGEVTPDLGTTFLGRATRCPSGRAPVGMSGLIWPDAERLLARHAARRAFPIRLSTVATRAPEDMRPVLGDQGLVPALPAAKRSGDPRDMLARAKDAGFHTLVLTVDLPEASRRERQTRGGGAAAAPVAAPAGAGADLPGLG
jgi:L-lactate dehydrogenase (cytochrome)